MASTILSDNGVTSGSAGLKTTAASDGALALQTTTAGGTATTALTIDTSQNVGVGTTSPSDKLQVTGGYARIDNSGASALRLYNSTTQVAGIGLQGWSGLGSANDLSVGTVSSNNTIFMTALTERMRIDSSGNVGVGTSSPTGKFQVVGSGGNAYIDNNGFVNSTQALDTSSAGGRFLGYSSQGKLGEVAIEQTTTGAKGGYIRFGTCASGSNSPTDRMIITSAGNVGIGTSSPGVLLDVTKNQNALTAFNVFNNDSTNSSSIAAIRVGYDSTYHFSISRVGNAADILQNVTQSTAPLVWQQAGTEMGRFSGNRYFKATSTGSYLGGALNASYHEFVGNGANSYDLILQNTNATPLSEYMMDYRFTGSAPNNTSARFWNCNDTGGTRGYLYSNGGLANYSANNSNLSDRREKTNFAPAKPYLDTICSIPVQTFNYIDQNMEEDPDLTLGVVAQDVQTVAPELVHESNWGTEEEPKLRLSIYQTDLQYALMKSIQELKAINDTQAETINALTARIVALEQA